MNTTLVKNAEKHYITHQTLMMIIVVFTIILVTVAYLAYHYGSRQTNSGTNPRLFETIRSAQASIPQSTYPQQNREVLLEGEVIALTQKLSQLQAEMVRLNELGKQLVAINQLDKEEFDFDFDWQDAMTEKEIIAMEDLPEEELLDEEQKATLTDIAAKEKDKTEKAKKEDKKGATTTELASAAKSSKEKDAKKEDKKGATTTELASAAKSSKEKEGKKVEDTTQLASATMAKPSKEKAENAKEEKQATSTQLLASSSTSKQNKKEFETAKQDQKQNSPIELASLSIARTSIGLETSLAKHVDPETILNKLKEATEEKSREINTKRDELKALENVLIERRSHAKILPQGWPVKQGYLSSGFGKRGRRMHKGVDLVTRSGTPVYAVDSGTVVFSGVQRGYGNLIVIKHGDTYSTKYGHNSKNIVKEGDTVNKGQLIGLVGATGRATTAHVHFEVVKSGAPINPLKYLGQTETFELSEK